MATDCKQILGDSSLPQITGAWIVTHKRVLACFVNHCMVAECLCIIVCVFARYLLCISIQNYYCLPSSHWSGLLSHLCRFATPSDPNSSSARRSGSTALTFYFSFTIPFHIFVLIFQSYGPTTINMNNFPIYSANLLLLNLSLNPVICCWKMQHIRQTLTYWDAEEHG